MIMIYEEKTGFMFPELNFLIHGRVLFDFTHAQSNPFFWEKEKKSFFFKHLLNFDRLKMNLLFHLIS